MQTDYAFSRLRTAHVFAASNSGGAEVQSESAPLALMAFIGITLYKTCGFALGRHTNMLCVRERYGMGSICCSLLYYLMTRVGCICYILKCVFVF